MGLLGEIMVRFGADTSGFTASTSAAAASVASVGAATVSTSAYLDSLGASAFTTGAGFDGMAASAAAAAVSTAGVTASTAAVDTSLAGTAVASADASTALQAVAVSEDEVAASSKASALNLGMIGIALAAVVVGAGALAVKSMEMSGAFQNAMLQNVAHAGLAKDQFDKVSQSVLKMAGDVGQAPVALAKALYPIYSGLSEMTNQSAKAQVGLAELSNASKSVIGTTTDVVLVSRAATSAFNALGLGSNDAGKSIANMNTLFDVMNQTVSQGDMTWTSYTPIVGKLAIAIKGTSTSFVEANAALATMTNQGISAKQATTYLAASFTTLDDKSGGVAKRAAALGLSFDEARFKTLNLAQQMDYLKGVTGGNSEELLKLMNNNVSVMRTYKALETGMASYKTNLDAIGHSQGATAAAFATASQGMSASMDKMKGAGQALMITIGSELLPIISRLINQITPMITGLISWENHTHTIQNAFTSLVGGITTIISVGAHLSDFFQHNAVAMVLLKTVGIALAGVLGGIMVAALVAFAVAAWAAVVPLLPFIAIGALVALAIAGIILVITHWGEIMHWIGGVFSAVGAQLRESATKIKNDVGGIFNALGTQMRESVTKVKNDVGGAFDNLGTQMRQSATKTKNDVGGIFSGLGTLAHNAGQSIVDAGKWMYDHNTYWKAAADGMGKAYSDLGTQMHLSATKTKNDVAAQFNDMGTQLHQSSIKTHDDVGNIFDGLGTHVSQAVNTMRDNSGAGFSSLGSQARGVMSALRTDVLDNIGRAVGGFMSEMGSLVSGAAGKLGELTGDFFSALGGLASQAWTWGSNIIGNLIGGIASRLGELAGVVGQAAGQLASILGFHSPAKEGPGRDADQWMPNLIKMMQAGLIAGEPTIKNAAIQVASMLSPMIDVHSSGSVSSSSSSGQGNGTQTIIIQMDGRDVAKALGPHLTNEIRLVAQVRR